jgi:phospholipid/cholesterol/gamma-HCH transport system permease protein
LPSRPSIGRSTLGLLGARRPVTLFFLATLTVSHILTPALVPARILGMQLLHIGWLQPAGGRADRAVHRRRAGAADLRRRGALQRRGRGALRSSPSAWCASWAPVLGGLMVAGRVAASIAAEIGTMKVTEQIDALVTLSTNPMKYLTAPRVLAATLSLPVLAGSATASASWAAFSSAPPARLQRRRLSQQHASISSRPGRRRLGPVKGDGLRLHRRADGLLSRHAFGPRRAGVGRATTKAVVSASILILAANYILTEVFFSA